MKYKCEVSGDCFWFDFVFTVVYLIVPSHHSHEVIVHERAISQPSHGRWRRTDFTLLDMDAPFVPRDSSGTHISTESRFAALLCCKAP